LQAIEDGEFLQFYVEQTSLIIALFLN